MFDKLGSLVSILLIKLLGQTFELAYFGLQPYFSQGDEDHECLIYLNISKAAWLPEFNV